MNILIAGASGFIGRQLVDALKTQHKLTVLGRDSSLLNGLFSQEIARCTWDNLDNLSAKQFDVIINLCGHNIGASRWSNQVKQQLIDSRVKTSEELINWAIKHEAKPHFYCANAIGIYGMQSNEDTQTFDEDSVINFNQPCDFLSEIGVRWQAAMQPAIDYGMNVTITRFGVALMKGQGMLKKLSPSFYLGLGAVVGDGRQVISWIHIADIVGAFSFLLNHPALCGAFNLSSPNPVSQKEFARIFAKILRRPLLLTMPAWFIKLVFGEMGECLLLKGQRVLPKRLTEEGYQFQYPDLSSALAHEFK